MDVIKREGMVLVGPCCCGEARLRTSQGIVVIVCPKHLPKIIVDGKLQPLEPIFAP